MGWWGLDGNTINLILSMADSWLSVCLNTFSCPEGRKGSEDPEREGYMFQFFGNKAGRGGQDLNRIFKEFPWLWGVSQRWLFGANRIEIRRADDTILTTKHLEDRPFWVKCGCSSLHTVKEGVQKANQTLATAVHNLYVSYEDIRYLVIVTVWDLEKKCPRDYMLLKPPKESYNFDIACLRLKDVVSA